LFAFGVLQNALAGGLIFGWASIDQSILSESPEKGGAGLDLQQTTKIFSWATSISMVAALILGAVLDHSGPRLASIISCLTIAAGCLIFALSNHVFGFALGTVLMGFGGPGIGNCIIHLANLFPGNENLAMSSLSGSIALSFSMFAFFDMTWTNNKNVTFRDLFIGFAMLLVVLAIGALVLYPDEPYEQLIDDDIFEEVQRVIDMEAEPLIIESQQQQGAAYKNVVNVTNEEHHEGVVRHRHGGHAPPHVSLIVEQPFNSYLRDKQRMVERTDSFVASSKSLAGGGPVMSLKDMPLWDQLTSATYIRAFFVFLVTTFVTNFYVGTLSTEVSILACLFTDWSINSHTCSFVHSLSALGSAELLCRNTT
jgi:MFS family permease